MDGASGAERRTGLTADEVAERVRLGRTNRRPPTSSRSVWAVVRANLFTYFNGIVFGGFGVLLALGFWQDGLFGLTALANTVIGIAQELRTKRSLDRLAILTAPRARVLRDGTEALVRSEEVVLDDLLVLRPGEQLVADAVLLEARGLAADESLLTGESAPVARNRGDAVSSGVTIVAGTALARVTAVGAAAVAGRLAAESRRFSLVRSELRSATSRLLRWIGWALVPLSLLMLNAQVQVQGGWPSALRSDRWRTAAVDTISAVIAMIPLGLVLITSITFAVGAASLARRRVLVQELAAVEGLARVDVLCIDKTGTLTDGRTELEGVHLADGVELPESAWASALGWFAAAPWAGPTVGSLAERFPPHPVETGPVVEFSSTRRWSAAVLDGAAPGTWVLGAPERVGELLGFGGPPDTRPASAAAVRRAAELAAVGLRTLLLAHTAERMDAADADAERPPEGLRPVAILAFREHVRPDARTTLAYFREQGVEVRILSGDDPRTVTGIARAVGLDRPDAVDADALPEEPEAFARAVVAERVLARVTPAQKVAAVRALQAAGRTVAMTGDGANDALAVKVADLGIAMGSGAAATKAVSRIVLLDDAFAGLPDVVAEGRRAVASIERVSILFLTKTTYAMALSAVLGVLLLQTPFLPRQLFVTDGLTIGIPAFLLALLPDARRYRPGFLRRALGSAVPNGLVVAACLVALALTGRFAGVAAAPVRTCATVLLAVLGLWVLGRQARPLRGLRLVVVVIMVAAAVLGALLPATETFLGLLAPPAWCARLTAVLAVSGCVLIEVVQRLREGRRADYRRAD
ncbi:MAG: HAD-IC family P-type ATPase [Amnibacterium sp.]